MTNQEVIECECCPNIIPKDLSKNHKGMILCQECYDKEKAVTVEDIIPIPTYDAGQFRSKEEFFNASERTDIGLIEGTPYERAIKIRERIDHNQQILFEARVRSNAAYDELIKLAVDLKAEEREKVKVQSNFTYEPNIIKVKKERAKPVAKEDKALLSMATVIFGKKMQLLDQVNKEIYKEHPDWFSNGIVVESKKKEYNDQVLAKGAMTEEQAIARVKETVRSSRAINFQQLASGERKLSDD